MTEDSGKKSQVQLPKKTFTVELVVGVFTIVGLCSLAYLAINIAGIRISSAGYYDIYAEFDNVSGLTADASVEIAGVPVGTVKNISLDTTSALVTLEIVDGVKIRDDDIVAIRTKGIIGDRYVKITPGGSEMFLAPGDRISDTESVVEFEEIIGKFIHNLE